MRIHTFDGKQYIALGDFDWLRHNLIKDIRDKYEQGQTPSAEDIGAIGAYSHIMVEILKDKLHAAHEEATDAESLREGHDRIYRRIRWEWAEDKWLICATDKTLGEEKTVYFARMDEGPNDTETPVFTDQKRKAYFFEDHYSAECRASWLRKHIDGMEKAVDNVRVEAAYLHFTDMAERLLNAIFGDEDDGHEYCIFLEPMGDGNGLLGEDNEPMGEDNGSWFSQWIKHRDDLPQGTKDWLEAAGVEPGESVPMFTGGNAPIMKFKYKGMAEKTAEKIAEMYPQFEGKLHVQIYEEMPDDRPQEDGDTDAD